MPTPPSAPVTVHQQMLVASLAEQLGLARLEQGVVRRILGLLNAADADLERQLQLALDRGKEGTATTTRLRHVRSELRKALAESYQALGEQLRSDLLDVAAGAPEAAAGIVEGALPFAFSMTRPDAGMLRAIVTSRPFQGALLNDHVSRLSQNRLDALTLAVQLGLVEGETTDQITRRVRGTEAAGFEDGALALGRHQATALTRTAVQHVHADAREALYLENPDVVTAVMALVTLDERTCRICGPRDGLVWSLPEHKPKGHEVSWDGGPGKWHWQCRCTILAVLADLDEFEALGVDVDALGPGERAAMGGPVTVDTDYEDWLRDASPRTRRRALGVRRAAWWDAHPDVSLSEAWARRFDGRPIEPATIAEILPPLPPPPPPPLPPSVVRYREVLVGDGRQGGWSEGQVDDALAEVIEDAGGDLSGLSGLEIKGRLNKKLREQRLGDAREIAVSVMEARRQPLPAAVKREVMDGLADEDLRGLSDAGVRAVVARRVREASAGRPKARPGPRPAAPVPPKPLTTGELVRSGTVSRSEELPGTFNAVRRVSIAGPSGEEVTGYWKPGAPDFDAAKARAQRDLLALNRLTDLTGPELAAVEARREAIQRELRQIAGGRAYYERAVRSGGGDFADREVLAWDIDRALGTGLVPETHRMDIGGVAGTFQVGVEGDSWFAVQALQELGEEGGRDLGRREAIDMTLLDFVLGNADRHSGNALLGADNLWAIDHGFSFLDPSWVPPDLEGLPSTEWSLLFGQVRQRVTDNWWFGEELTRPELERWLRRLASPRLRRVIADSAIGDAAKEAALARIDELANILSTDQLLDFLENMGFNV